MKLIIDNVNATVYFTAPNHPRFETGKARLIIELDGEETVIDLIPRDFHSFKGRPDEFATGSVEFYGASKIT